MCYKEDNHQVTRWWDNHSLYETVSVSLHSWLPHLSETAKPHRKGLTRSTKWWRQRRNESTFTYAHGNDRSGATSCAISVVDTVDGRLACQLCRRHWRHVTILAANRHGNVVLRQHQVQVSTLQKQLAALPAAGHSTPQAAVCAECHCTTDHWHARSDHISPVLRELHWLPIRERVKFKVACLVRQSLSRQAPLYLADDWRLVSDSTRRSLGGNVTSAGWQVILCDPIWHVSSRSGEASR